MTNIKVQKSQTIVKLISTFITVLSLGSVFYFLLISDSLVIGIGEFENIVHKIESIDYRWWILSVSAVVFLISLSLTILFSAFDLSKIELDQLRDSFYNLIKGKEFPVLVDVDETIKVTIEEKIKAKFSVDTKLDIKDTIHIKTTIPIDLRLPIDTIIETSVLGLGSLRIPIKTTIPLKMEFPFEGEIDMNLKGFHLQLSEIAEVELPSLEIPIKSQLKAVLNLESNIRNVEVSLANKK